MRRAGLPDDEAAACYRVFADFVLAYAGMDAALAALAPSTREAELLTWDVDYRRLPPERFPNAAATAGALPAARRPAQLRARRRPHDRGGRGPGYGAARRTVSVIGSRRLWPTTQ